MNSHGKPLQKNSMTVEERKVCTINNTLRNGWLGVGGGGSCG